MFYLITQMAFFLIVAVLAGLAAGWWIRSKTVPDKLPGTDAADDPFDARFRLEQCHRDNAALRRSLKDNEAQLEKANQRLKHSEKKDGDDDIMERLDTCEIRVQALLEDLQVRDDTIAAMEKELAELYAGDKT